MATWGAWGACARLAAPPRHCAGVAVSCETAKTRWRSAPDVAPAARIEYAAGGATAAVVKVAWTKPLLSAAAVNGANSPAGSAVKLTASPGASPHTSRVTGVACPATAAAGAASKRCRLNVVEAVRPLARPVRVIGARPACHDAVE